MASAETLELPAPVYQSLLDAARESGLTPADWIAARLPRPANGTHAPSAAEVAEANARLRACRVVPERRTSTLNEDIDADLVRAYGDERAD